MQEQHDIKIKSMHRFLKSKCNATVGINNSHIRECVEIVNNGTLAFFEATFNADLKRLKLI